MKRLVTAAPVTRPAGLRLVAIRLDAFRRWLAPAPPAVPGRQATLDRPVPPVSVSSTSRPLVRVRAGVRRALSAGIVLASVGVLLTGPDAPAHAPAVLAAQPAAGLGGFRQVAMRPWLDHGKPVVLFVGAQFCPHCAAERWALVLALGRFGRWSGLGKMRSTQGEMGFPGLATYDLLHATYRSTAVAVQMREIADFAGRPLQALTPRQSKAVDAYNPRGGIPFVLIGGRYAQVGAGFSPAVIQGLSFARIHALVYTQPTSTVSRAVTKEANIISALICSTLAANTSKTAACRLAAVRTLLAKL